jgi:hypothetical protein
MVRATHGQLKEYLIHATVTNDNRVSGVMGEFGPDALALSWCPFPIRNDDERPLALSWQMI